MYLGLMSHLFTHADVLCHFTDNPLTIRNEFYNYFHTMDMHTFLTIQEPFLKSFILLLMCNISHSRKPCNAPLVIYPSLPTHTRTHLFNEVCTATNVKYFPLWQALHPCFDIYTPPDISYMPLGDMPQIHLYPLITHNSLNEAYTVT